MRKLPSEAGRPKPLLKEHFSWREPKEYLRLKDANERPAARRIQLLVFFAIVGVVLLRRLINNQRNLQHESIGESLCIALAGAAFLAYGIPWVVTKCPSYIKVRNKHIMRMRGNSNLEIRFSKMESFRWIPMQQWSLLRLSPKSGRSFTLCVPLEISREELDSFLQEHGLRKDPDGHYTDFEDIAFLRNAV
jgi:hypothetical protein